MTLEATAMQAEQAKTKKTVHRTTTIKFESEDLLNEAFAHYGLTVRDEVQVDKYFDDDGEELYARDVRLLRKHGVGENVRREIRHVWEYTFTHEGEVKEYFKLTVQPSIASRTILISTYDMTSRQHQAEVRKILRPLRWAGFRCTYTCESEVTNSAC